MVFCSFVSTWILLYDLQFLNTDNPTLLMFHSYFMQFYVTVSTKTFFKVEAKQHFALI